jgi:TonB family protein
MTPALWLDNLAAYSGQIAVLVSAAALLVYLLRLRNPRALYRGWQLTLGLCLLMPFLQPWREAAPRLVGPAAGPVSSILRGTAPPTNLADLVLAVVALGVAVRLGRLFLGLAQLRRLRRSSRRLQQLPEPLSRLREDLGPSVGLYLSSRLEGAVSFGFRQPAILLPDGFLAMDLAVQRAVLCHELLHARRRDWVFAVGEEVSRSLLWFHPAVWWVVERIQLAREQVVDCEVVRRTGERDCYLEALLQTAALRARTGWEAAPTFLRTRHLRQRVALILKEDIMSKKRLAISMAVAACALAITAIWAGWSIPLLAPLQASPQRGGDGKVYKVGVDRTSAPRLIEKIEPQYTEEARDAQLQGTVVLGVEVGSDGRAHNIHVRRGLGLGLDESAMDAIRQWEFAPGMRGGQPVTVAATIEVNFRLR